MGPKYRWYYRAEGWVYAAGPTRLMDEQEFILFIEGQGDLNLAEIEYWRET